MPMLARFLPIGAFHAVGHIAGIVGTSQGSVSFAQVVKSARPILTLTLTLTLALTLTLTLTLTRL